jgi:ATP-binding cassette subfamily B protein
VLRGYGLDVPYAEIARLSAVDVEGASIDRLEVLANQFGLGAEQVMLPVDHVFLPGQHRGPTIAVAKTTEGLKHFLVLWRASGETVEIMDPSVGQRSWVPRTELLSRLYVHQISLPAKSWNEWAHSAEFREGLLERMRRLRVSGSDRQALWVAASNDPSPLGLEALDAAIRFEGIGATVRPDAGKDVRQLFECSRTPSCVQPRVPPNYWFAREGGRDKAGESQVAVRGAVMIAFQRRIGPIR